MNRVQEGLRANREVRRKKGEPSLPQTVSPPQDSLKEKAGKDFPQDDLSQPPKGTLPVDGLPGWTGIRLPVDRLLEGRAPSVSFSMGNQEGMMPERGETPKTIARWVRCTARRYPGLDRGEELI